jgi:hypothetical protein
MRDSSRASCVSQIQAFKGIINLTTRYLGLRRLFVESPHINDHVQSYAKISGLWERHGEELPRGGTFVFQFAAFCIASNDATMAVEAVVPSQLGRTSNVQRTTVESLLTDVE